MGRLRIPYCFALNHGKRRWNVKSFTDRQTERWMDARRRVIRWAQSYIWYLYMYKHLTKLIAGLNNINPLHSPIASNIWHLPYHNTLLNLIVFISVDILTTSRVPSPLVAEPLWTLDSWRCKDDRWMQSDLV